MPLSSPQIAVELETRDFLLAATIMVDDFRPDAIELLQLNISKSEYIDVYGFYITKYLRSYLDITGSPGLLFL